MGAGGSRPSVPGPPGLQGDHRLAGRQDAPAGSLHGQHEGEDPNPSRRRGHRFHDLLPHQARLLHLPQDVCPEAGHQRHLRPVRLPRHRRHHPRLLQRPRRDPRYVQARAGAFQGLYLHPEAQYVPERAHHGHRLRGHPLRGADPHLGYAPYRRIRHRRPLEVQDGRRQRRPAPGGRGQVRLGAPPAGEPAGVRRAGLLPRSEDRHVRRRGLRLLAQGRRHQPPRRRHPHRLRLLHPLRRRQPHGRRQGQRPHRHLRLRAAERRHRRDPHLQIRPRPQPRLAEPGQERLRPHQDQAVVQEGAPGGERHPRPRDARGRAQAQ